MNTVTNTTTRPAYKLLNYETLENIYQSEQKPFSLIILKCKILKATQCAQKCHQTFFLNKQTIGLKIKFALVQA